MSYSATKPVDDTAEDSAAYVPSLVAVGPGIDPSGVADSTAALQAKLTAAAGGVLFIPSGTFAVSVDLTVPASTRIQGAGRDRTTIKLTGGNRGFYCHNTPKVTIEDLTVDGNKAATADGGTNAAQQCVYFLADNATGCPGARIRRVRAVNGHYKGIQAVATTAATNPLDIDIIDCESTDHGDAAAGVGAYGIEVSAATRSRIRDTVVRRCGGYGFRIGGGSNCDFTGNTAADQGNNHGIVFSSGLVGLLCRGNVASNNHHAGGVGQTQWGIVVSIDVAQFVIEGNYVAANDGGITIDVAEADPSVFINTQGSIVGNICVGATRSNGLNVNHADGLVITGNHCYGNSQDGIQITGRNCHVSGNSVHGNGRRGIAYLESGDNCGPHTHGVNSAYGNNTVAGAWTDVYTDTLTGGPVVFTAAGIVSGSESDTQAVNTAAETVFASTTSPVNPRLAVGDRLILRVEGEVFNNTAGAVTYTFRMKIGATTVFTTNALSLTAGANPRPFYIEAVIALAALNSEIVGGHIIGFASTSGVTLGTAGAYGAIKGVAAEDMTTAKTVSVSVTMSVADVNASVTKHACSLERIPKIA